MKVYGEERVNSYVSNDQSAPAVAPLAGGGYVTTWVSQAQDGSGEGIFAQRMDANGVAVGPEFRVNTTTGGTQADPRIAALSDGGFVVVWSDYDGTDGSGYGIFAQRFNASGVAQGSQFLVNTTTSSTQYESSVAAYNGGFVITWASHANNVDTSGYGVFGSRFDNAGNLLQTGGQSEFQVNTYTTNHQWEPDVAAYADGRYVVVWRSEGQEGDGYSGVYAQRYDSSGTKVGGELHVNTYETNYQFAPRVSTLSDGGFVVVWQSRGQDGSNDGVYGQRYDAFGNAAGGEFRVNVATDNDQGHPDVTGLSTGGFVVTWYSYYVPAEAKYYEIYTREYDATGTPITGEQKVNTFDSSSYGQYSPVVADLGEGNYVVTWTSQAQDSGTSFGIYQQIFGDPADFSRQGNPVLGDFAGSVTFAENTVNASLQVLDAAVSLTDADSADFDGGRIELYYVKAGAMAEDQLGVVHEGTAPGRIGVSGSTVSYGGTAIGTISGVSDGTNGASLIIDLNANASVDAVEQLIQRLGYGNSSGNPTASREVGIRVSDGDGGSTFGGIISINVTSELDGTPAAYGEQQVNTYSYDYQHNPEVARLTDGGYVVVWTSRSQDSVSDADGVYAQRYNASGVAVGPEFRVPTLTGSSQNYAHVAGLSDGGFVITWQDNAGYDGSGWGVFGQRYDMNGVAQGSQFALSSDTSNDQYHDAVSTYAGGFATVWSSYNPADGGYHDIYLRRFNNDGTALDGTQLLVSTTPGNAAQAQSGHQFVPDIATLNDGDLLIVWRDDNGNDGSSHGVYARRFDVGTGTFGDSFLVNTRTDDAQYETKVAALSDGGYVVVWRENNQDGSGSAVMAQRYGADDSKVGTAIRVNEYTTGSQYEPDVIGLSSGGFVVSFFNDYYGPDGTSANVYIREYDAAGNPVDGDRLVNTYTSNNQHQPAMADLGQGNYVVVWRSDYQDGSNSGIYQQLFGDTAELPRSAHPELADFTGTVSFNESAVNAGLQVIDSAANLIDSDSANFNGGRLDLYYLTGQAAEDQLGVVHQGNAAGQIGVSGTTVSYGGTAIGTISGGSNGANLRIDFTSDAATADAVEALIQRLGYANPDSSPNASRTLGLRVSDGDGGSSAPNVLTINVTPELDGTAKAYGEEQLNTYTPGDQSSPEVGHLSDGGYVVVWNSNGQDGSSWGIYAQRFNASGVAVGPEWQVNSLTGGEQSYAHVAGLSDGGFVITWQDANGHDGSGWGVFGQRYDASSVAQGSQFLVNTYIDSTQYHDALTAYGGGFATVWSSYSPADSGYHDITLQRWDNAGNKVGGELLVSTSPGSGTSQPGYQFVPDIAALADGDLLVVWRDDNGNDGSSHGVYARRFDAATASFGDSFLVNTGNTSGAQYEPKVAALNDGGYVIVWRDDNQDGSSAAVMGQRYDASGAAVGSPFRANENTAGGQYQPDVIGLSTGGFVVSFYNDNWGSQGTYSDVYVREYDAAGNPVDGDRQINDPATNHQWSNQQQPALADLGNGNYVAVWASDNNQDGSSNGIYQQLFGDIVTLPRPSANPDLADFVGTATFNENAINAGLQIIDAAVSLTDSDSSNFNGGRLDLYYLTGQSAADQLGVVHQGIGAGHIGVSGSTVSYGGTAIGTISGGSNGASLRIDFSSDAATPDAVEALIQRLGYANADSSPNASRTLGLRVSDGDGGSSTANVLTINVIPELDGTSKAYGEEQVNTYTPNSQSDAAVASLTGGGYVIAWTSYDQDGSVDGVHAQRYSASGVAVGPEFRVNSTTASTQNDPAVAGLSDGGFVVTWQDSATDGSSYGVFGQRYDASGIAQGGEFPINTYTDNEQSGVKIAAYDGGFVTTWTSWYQDGYGYGIYSQRFDNTGAKVGGETQVHSTNTYSQYGQDVAARSDGSHVIVWQSADSQDGSGWGVYGQRFDTTGAPVGTEFLVNTTTVSSQYQPRVAMLSDGDFVVVWYDDGGQDGSGGAVFAQRLNADGSTDGGQFRVNEYTTGSQYQPTVIGLSTGGFVVSFYNDNYGPEGTYYDVCVREYDAAGNPIEGDRQINNPASSAYWSTQSQPALADLGNGNYVSVWTSDYQDGSSNGIYQQIFGDPAELPRQANPVLEEVVAVVTLGEAQAVAAQIIDADVWVSDSDSANFDTGSLWVYFTSGQLALDVLAVNHEGDGVGQIGVSGSDISYGGTAIGTVAGGSAGAPLVISFNASATSEAVRHLVESITYQYNDTTAPTGSRSVAFRLFDGDGGASAPASTTISIEASSLQVALGLSDLDDSITLPEAAAQLGAVLDENVAVTQGADPITTLTVSYVSGSGRPEDQLSIRHQGTGAGQVGFNAGTGEISYEGTVIGTVNAADTGADGDTLVVDFNGSATAQAVERVIENLRYQTTSDGPLASRTIQVQLQDSAFATTSQNLVIDISPEDDGAQPLFGDEQVNTYEAGDQYYPRVVGLEGPNAGSYVVVWRSPGEDGSGNGVFAQRYNADGVQVGTEFQVNTYASNEQTEPMVASLANGGFVVVWRSEGQDGSSGGVYAQRYGADGSAAGSEFRVSDLADYDQTHPTALGLVDGSFVIAWTDQYRDTSSYGAFAQRYAADGTPQGAVFPINSYLPNEQYVPYLAALTDDPATTGANETGFIAVWESNAQDGSGWGVYAQRFDLAGAKVGSEFRVNTTTAGNQTNPDVAVLSSSRIVVVWNDDSTGSIRGQLYTAGGVTVGGEFTASTSDFSSDYGQWPHVTALQNGGFVVSWDGYSSPSDSGHGVYAQEFDASGNKVDGPFSLTSSTANTQIYPDIAALTGNNFVAVWMSHNQEAATANTYGVFQSLFGTPGSITRQSSPELIDLDSSVSFNENVVNAGAQILDSGVRVVDSDSANFDGGRLVVSVITGYGAAQAFDPAAYQQDHFSVRDQGTGAAQVGFNAGTGVVSYGGTAIGSLVSNGQNGADLVLQFNASATAEAVEAVIENLSYRNSSSNPTASRQVSVVVSDGDGGQSAPRVMTINVAAQTDGATALLNEDQRVNTYTAGDQIEPMIAALRGGNAGQYVVVWESNGQDSDGWGVFAQRYDVNGSAIGPEFQVNSHTPGNQLGNSLLGVAGLSTGGFVVAWDSDGQDGSNYGVYAQRYGADGQPAGSEFLVNTATSNHQFQAQVLGLDGGAFVIAYTDYLNADGDSYGVRLQHYDASGGAQGAPFTVNTHVAGNQSFAQLAKLNDGGYVVTWHSDGQDGSNWSVQARLMNANGTPRSAEFQVNTYTVDNQSNPDVAVLTNGDFVVSWVSNNSGLGGWSIMAQRYTAAGVKVGGEMLVNDGNSAPSNGDTYSRITALDSGGYVITWSDSSGVSSYEAMAQQFDSAGNKVDGPLMLNSYTSSTQYRPDVAGLTGDRWVGAWQSYGQDGDQHGIYQNLFGPAGSLTKSAPPVITDLAASITVAENAANQPAGVLVDPAVSVFDADSADFAGGRVTVSVISGYNSLGSDLSQNLPTQDHFSVRNQGSGAGQVGFGAGTVSYGGTAIGSIVPGFNGQNGVDLVIEFNAQASAEAVEAVIENLTYRNSSSDPVPGRLVSVTVSDGDGATSAPRTVQINVTAEADGGIPLFNAEQVNTYTTSTQSAPAMAKLADGGYVTLWQSSGQDGWDYGIFGQRFAADGTRVGNEFRVSDYTPYNQTEVAVAGLNDGGFVAVFRGQYRDASGDAVIGQRFDANGGKVGNEFLVNTTADGSQHQPAVSALADGGFAVAWYSNGSRDGEYYDVFFQRFGASGNAVGLETRANTPISGNAFTYQSEPSIVQLSNGDILVAWRSDGQDGSQSGVYAQRFDSSTGNKIGSEFRLNIYTDDFQYAPSVTATASGFVAVWTSRGQDSSVDGVYARLFNNDGSPASAEFRVNDTYYNWQNAPQVATLTNGGFVVTWYDNSSSHRVLAQQYDAVGNRVDGELQLNGPGTTSDQEPAVVALGNGSFVVSWWGYYDASDSGIFQRIVGNAADFPRQTAPQIVDLVSSVTYMENLINDTPQLIDAGVGLIDPDSSNFDGGRLDVSYVTPYGNPNQFDIPGINAQDQLGIRNEGTGTDQIGVSGNSVTYNDGTGTVVIGSIVSDGINGKPLTVVFNANATPEAAEALIENLTYANPLSNPEPSRTISLSLSDGDGGVTPPRAITINITAQPDGASVYGAEKVVNSTTGGTQQNPAIAYLSNGNYVVVWEDQSGLDGSSHGIYARVYDVDDNPLGTQFLVNTTTDSTQYQPTVTALTGGGFTVAWAGYNQITASSGYDVVGRTFGNDGTPASAEFTINQNVAGEVIYEQSMPSLTALHNGGFVAAWYGSYEQASGRYYDIYAQRYDAAGAKDGAQFRVNASTGFESSYQDSPAVSTLADGRFVVVWRSDSQDGSSAGVYGQRFTADGTPDGAEFRANTYTANGQYQQDVAALNDGGYVVVWGSQSGQDTDGWGVYGQRFDSTGAAVGGEFRVNYTVSGNQSAPAVTSLANGGFVVSWTNSDEILFQQYDAAGRKVDSEQFVNADANYGSSGISDMVGTPDGGFLITYDGYNYGNSTHDIFLQRYSNQAPQVQDVSVVGPEDAPIILTDDLFASGFFDAEGQTLAAIKIITLPASGILKLDGVDVTPGQVISVADLAADKLTYLGDPNYYGPDEFRWNGSDGNVFATTSVFTNITVNNVNDGPALEAGVNRTANEGTHFSHSITLGDPDPTDVHLVTVSWVGSGGQTGSYQFNTSSGTPAIGLTLPDDGSYTVTVTANDQQGQANSIETDSFSVTVDNVAPTLPYLSGNNTVEQGQVYTLDLNGPYDYLPSPVVDPGTDTVTEYRIDWGDGTAVQIIAAGSLPANGQVTHIYATAGTPTIRIALVDEDGTHADAGTKSITVAPPAEVIVVDAGADASVNEGTLFSRTISFTDPADQDPAGRNVTVDWGDGSAAQNFRIGIGVTDFNIQHVFADNNAVPYNVTVTVDDDGFQSDSDSFLVTINDMAPTLGLGGNGSTPEGAAYSLTLGAVSDPGTDTVSQYIVHWGDGNAQSFLPGDLPPSREVQHVYDDGDVSGTQRTITVDLVNEDGTFQNVASKLVSVTNVAPTVPVSGAATIDEGSVYTLNVGAVVDPGVDTPTLYRINWGDGSQTDFTPTQYADLLVAGGNVTHTFADGNAAGTLRNIVLQVLDEDGTHNAGSLQVTVNNVAPTIALAGNASVNEGATYTLNLGTVTDPGTDTVASYSIDWGDGTVTAGNAGDNTHVYADGVNNYTIQVSVTDEDGTHLAGSKAVTVNDVAPTIALVGAASADEGASYTLNLGTVTDPGTDTVASYSIDWGDGTVTAGNAGDNAHVYADGANNYTIQVSVTDEDGTHLAGSKAVTVNDVAPTIALVGAASADEGASYTLNLGTVTDPGTDTVASYSIDWGDGTVTAGNAGDNAHVYADGANNYTIQVSVTDEDGTHLAGSKAVTVNNVAPSIALAGAVNV
ncbi:MAG TPA: PKD domain-containing protein, partial [Candidatus Accumulibacter phosphatis]|nr:PKD domain-containing protein [Candidatus Accumulibacter phosphatis]